MRTAGDAYIMRAFPRCGFESAKVPLSVLEASISLIHPAIRCIKIGNYWTSSASPKDQQNHPQQSLSFVAADLSCRQRQPHHPQRLLKIFSQINKDESLDVLPSTFRLDGDSEETSPPQNSIVNLLNDDEPPRYPIHHGPGGWSYPCPQPSLGSYPPDSFPPDSPPLSPSPLARQVLYPPPRPVAATGNVRSRRAPAMVATNIGASRPSINSLKPDTLPAAASGRGQRVNGRENVASVLAANPASVIEQPGHGSDREPVPGEPVPGDDDVALVDGSGVDIAGGTTDEAAVESDGQTETRKKGGVEFGGGKGKGLRRLRERNLRQRKTSLPQRLCLFFSPRPGYARVVEG